MRSWDGNMRGCALEMLGEGQASAGGGWRGPWRLVSGADTHPMHLAWCCGLRVGTLIWTTREKLVGAVSAMGTLGLGVSSASHLVQ